MPVAKIDPRRVDCERRPVKRLLDIALGRLPVFGAERAYRPAGEKIRRAGIERGSVGKRLLGLAARAKPRLRLPA